VTQHDDLRLALGSFALGNLDPVEHDAVLNHVERCPICRGDLAQLSAAAALVPLAKDAAGTEEPSPLLGRTVLEDFAGARRSPGRRARHLRIALPSAALGAFVAAGLLALSGGDGGMRVALSGAGASATARIDPTAEGARVRLDARLAPSRAGQFYELWFARGTARVSAGTFRVGAGGRARVTLNVAATPGSFQRLGITRSDPARGGPTVAAGDLQRD
jgi:hypothetical protein